MQWECYRNETEYVDRKKNNNNNPSIECLAKTHLRHTIYVFWVIITAQFSVVIIIVIIIIVRFVFLFYSLCFFFVVVYVWVSVVRFPNLTLKIEDWMSKITVESHHILTNRSTKSVQRTTTTKRQRKKRFDRPKKKFKKKIKPISYWEKTDNRTPNLSSIFSIPFVLSIPFGFGCGIVSVNVV